jgi:hypothetical protein
VAEHGAKVVRDQVAALLQADLPGRIDAACELWVLDRATLPEPGMVVSGDLADSVLDHRAREWIEVITPRLMPRTELVGFDASANLRYRFRYTARIYIWAINDRWPDVVDQRDRLMTQARDCLLDYPTLAIPPASGDTGFLIHIPTITEEFGEPFRIGKRDGSNPRARAGGLLAYEIIEEYAVGSPTTRPQPEPYTGFDLAVTLLPYTAPIGG